MSKTTAVFNRFPGHELTIRRLCVHEPDFLGICEDYEEAMTALRRWEGGGPEAVARANEYRVILGEIEADILQELSSHLLRVSQREK